MLVVLALVVMLIVVNPFRSAPPVLDGPTPEQAGQFDQDYYAMVAIIAERQCASVVRWITREGAIPLAESPRIVACDDSSATQTAVAIVDATTGLSGCPPETWFEESGDRGVCFQHVFNLGQCVVAEEGDDGPELSYLQVPCDQPSTATYPLVATITDILHPGVDEDCRLGEYPILDLPHQAAICVTVREP